MVTWNGAHRIASVAAAHAHHDFGVDVSSPPIDVAAVLAAAEIPLMWQPMPRLFGAYLCGAGLPPGVLVNSALPVGARRHTAAHEFGHHCLRHAATIDDGSCLHVDPFDDEATRTEVGRARWTDSEKTAEAFAAWFLMPRRAVLAAIRRMGLTGIESATDVYQLSLLLGTSFRSTLRHLPNLRLLSAQRANAWMTHTPGRLKAKLNPSGTGDKFGIGDVWSIDRRFDGSQIRIQTGDLLVGTFERGVNASVTGDSCLEIRASGVTSAGTWKSWIARESLGGRDGEVLVEAIPDPELSDGARSWSVSMAVETPPAGLDRHWLTRMELIR